MRLAGHPKPGGLSVLSVSLALGGQLCKWSGRGFLPRRSAPGRPSIMQSAPLPANATIGREQRPPEVAALRSADEATSQRAWSAAYPLLREAGLRIANVRMSGAPLAADRDDVVSAAVHAVVRGLVENRTESFTKIRSWDDCLGMMRSITRARIADFHRSRYRNREDAVGNLPEPSAVAEPKASGSRSPTSRARQPASAPHPPSPRGRSSR
ncbi:hypothetical protein BH23VER1_BH23VER1_13520 [soil metagenome]